MKEKLIITTWLLSLALIVASAYMHLSNVGIGNPDDVAHYGIIATGQSGGVAGRLGTAVKAITPSAFADRLHRAVANILEVLIIAIVVLGWMRRKNRIERFSLTLPFLGLFLSLVLAFLGAWYGSPLRYPWIMISNLVGGYALFAIYWWMTMDLHPAVEMAQTKQHHLYPWLYLALGLVMLQILFGAWTDGYYAAMARPTEQWGGGWSLTSLWQGASQLGQLHVDPSGRIVTDPDIAASIRTSHLFLAIPLFIVFSYLGWQAWVAGGRLRLPALLLLMILLAQVLVGLFMLWTGLSLLQVVAHTVLAALLLLSLLTLFHRLLRSDVDR